MRTRPASLRGRLVLGATAVTLTFAVLFGVGAAWLIQRAEDQAIKAALQSRVELARDEVAPDGTLREDAGSPKTDLVQVLSPDGSVRSASPSLAGLDPLVDVEQVVVARGGYQSDVALQQPDIDLTLLAVPVHLSASDSAPGGAGALVVGVDSEGFNTATSQLRWLLVAGLVAVVAVVGLLARVLTGRAFRSVTRLTEKAEVLGPNDLAGGLPVPAHDAELARLVAALNRMLVRLHESHTAELAFAADAGHRLRTPVATLRAEAELALRQEDRASRTAALENIVQDADRLTLIVDRMLARTRSRSTVPEPVINSLGHAGERWRRQADLSGVALDVRLHPSVGPDARCPALVEVVEAVVDNAIRHTPTGAWVRVEGHPTQHGELVLAVSNSGDGVPSDLAPHVFDPWVSSRDASVAGGLGLWLARETARDLGGDVTLADPGPGTCVFEVRLPLVRMS